MMPPLQPPDSLHLQAAKGWCELHAFSEANEELEKISPALRTHPSVLEVRWQLYANLEKHESALEIASGIVTVRPDWANGWIYKASSLTELKRHLEAHETLSAAAARFPGDEIIPYDLACVCCALKCVDEARRWVSKAIEVGGEEIRRRALDDLDLEPLWKDIGT
jgi:tetratricopeptide (TPR) repeat protein